MALRWDQRRARYTYSPQEGDEDTDPIDYPDRPDYGGATGTPGYYPEVDAQSDIMNAWADPGFRRGPIAGTRYEDVPGTGKRLLLGRKAIGKDYMGDPIYGEGILGSYTLEDDAERDVVAEKEAILGRRLTQDEREQLVFGRPPAGRDLRMTESEAGNLAVRREEHALDVRKQDETERRNQILDQLAQDAADLAALKAERDAKNDEAQREIERLTLQQRRDEAAALAAYRERQLAQDDQRISLQAQQLAQTQRQFEIQEERMRRAQATEEARLISATEEAYTRMFGLPASWTGRRGGTGAPGFGRITPEDLRQMAQYGR